MNATQLLQHIANENSISDNFVNVENENHDINIWFSRASSKWMLELDGKIIKDSKFAIHLVNKLADMNLLNN
tara:strand:+ start:415 stop:630 length:216 start_codon:yes stop_codon:yes gene_type:complete